MTATQPRVHNAQKYVVTAATTALGLFALLRLPSVESHVVAPLTRWQGDMAAAAFHTPAAPISVTLACSGTEVIAVCLGAVLAFPVAWRARLTAATVIVAGIIGLNTVRIGTLGLAADNVWWFEALHLYLWPMGLMLATAGAVFVWMRQVDRSRGASWSPSWRFVALALALLALSALAAPLYITSDAVTRLGGLVAHAGAVVLSAAGADVSATSNVLWTTRGGFSVTGDCVATPLLPLYLAAIVIYAPSWPRRLSGLLLTVPIFFVLAVVRLLLVALPSSIAPVPEFASHTFYQGVLALVLVVVAGRWRHGRGALLPVIVGIAAAVVCVGVAGQWYANAVFAMVDRPLLDPQGAIALWPSFQIALFVALWCAAGRRTEPVGIVAGLVVLGISQVAGVWLLNLPGVTTFLADHVSVVRAWSILAPAGLAWMLLGSGTSPAICAETVQNSTVSPVAHP